MRIKDMNNGEKASFYVGIICILFFVVFEIFAVFTLGEPISQGVGLLLIGVISIISSNSKYKKRTNKIQIEKQKRAEADRLAHTPACPICMSKKHVKHLSVIDRSVSAAIVGIASSAIGKQWTCTACGHDFNVDVAATPKAELKTENHLQYRNNQLDDPTEELRKYKQLLDDGVITQEDFDQKKKQLLDL